MVDITICSKCGVIRSLDMFTPDCNECNRYLNTRWRYRQNHKEQIKEYNKNYYQENKEQIRKLMKERIECPYCKCLVNKYTEKRHNQSKRHQKAMNVTTS